MAKISKILLALLLVLVMIVSVACGEGEDTNKDSDGGKGNSSSESGKNDKDDNDDNDDNDDDDKGSDDYEVTIAETVIYDVDGIKVTVTGYEEGLLGDEILLSIENNSDADVLITAESVSVNDYMMPYSSLFAEVAAGKKANETLYLMESELEQNGIQVVKDIDFYLEVSDPDTWDTIATSDLLHLYTTAGEVMKPQMQGDLIYDKDGIKITCRGLKESEIWDGTLVFEIENNYTQPICVTTEDLSVNDYMVEAGLWSSLRTGTRLVDGITLMELEDLDLESVDEISKIEFKLCISNDDSWEDIDTSDIITLTFE